MMNNLGSYKQTMLDQIHQAKPETLMVMLYEGLVARIKQAQERYKIGEKIKAKEFIIQAMRIADGLMGNLNFEQGGKTAENLEKLYFYIIVELSEANKESDTIKHLENTLTILNPLLESWKKLEKKVVG